MSVQGTLSVSGTPVLLNFSSSAQSQENGSLASVVAQLKEVREASNQAITQLMKDYPDEGKDIDLEEEAEEDVEEETPSTDSPVKETRKKRQKLDKRKKSQ